MKKVFNKKVADRVSDAIILACIGVVLLTGFFYYQQMEEIEKLKLRLETRHEIQERIIQAMKQENILDMEEFSEEERDQIREFADQFREE